MSHASELQSTWRNESCLRKPLTEWQRTGRRNHVSEWQWMGWRDVSCPRMPLNERVKQHNEVTLWQRTMKTNNKTEGRVIPLNVTDWTNPKRIHAISERVWDEGVICLRQLLTELFLNKTVRSIAYYVMEGWYMPLSNAIDQTNSVDQWQKTGHMYESCILMTVDVMERRDMLSNAIDGMNSKRICSIKFRRQTEWMY